MASDYDRIRAEHLRKYGEGKKHLEILGRLHSDRTHFVYELLQNAEDAGATRIEFDLSGERLDVSHDGRPFDEGDVRGICGLAEGTKEEDLTRTGKFGIGFKSVHAYTRAPEIHSGDEHFRIEDQVRPFAAGPIAVPDGLTTRFRLPFDREEPSRERAFAEVGDRLRALDRSVPLFLRSVGEIGWRIEGAGSGCYRRSEAGAGPARRITVEELAAGRSPRLSEFLVFERPVRGPDGAPSLPVEIAFWMKTDAKRPGAGISKTIRIPPESPLFALFATGEQTRLGFFVQGPFRTTLARDRILNDDPWNRNLIEEAAELAVEALHGLKEIGMLTASALAAMPLDEGKFQSGTRFRPLYERVREALVEEALIPAAEGGFTPGREAVLTHDEELRELLDSGQLAELTGAEGPEARRVFVHPVVTWKKRESRRLWYYFKNRLRIPRIEADAFGKKAGGDFFAARTDDWLVRFFRFLLKNRDLWRWRDRDGLQDEGPLYRTDCIRLADGRMVSPFRLRDRGGVLPPGRARPTVAPALARDPDARRFLAALGVRETEPDRRKREPSRGARTGAEPRRRARKTPPEASRLGLRTPRPVEAGAPAAKEKPLPEAGPPKITTMRGEVVRSKSELVIANMLHEAGVPYRYEKPLGLGECRLRPDFTVELESGVTWYWEHLGLLGDAGYRDRWKRKQEAYARSGIARYDDGGPPRRRLIVTRDERGGGLDSTRIAAVIARLKAER